MAMSSRWNASHDRKRTATTNDGHRQWQTSRPIWAIDPITLGWNQLLEDAASRQLRSRQLECPAGLDQEVVTLARAMRGLPVAWIITDTDGSIRFLGPAACGLLRPAGTGQSRRP